MDRDRRLPIVSEKMTPEISDSVVAARAESPPIEPTQPYYAVFVDILGFAQKVETLDADTFAEAHNYWTTGVLPRVASRAYALAMQYQQFSRCFDEYRRYVELDKVRRFAGNYKIHSFLFSDSCFVASPSLEDIIDFCRGFIVSMFLSEVPVRAGIGAGTFSTLDVRFQGSTFGDVAVTSPFLGSAIVRAYKAELSGLKGLRCFVHPSVVASSPPEVALQLLPLGLDEARDTASHELTYFSPRLAGIDSGYNGIIHYLDLMEAAAGPKYAEYYSRTRDSLAAMERRQEALA